jgi:hypothetical protein
MECLIAEMGSTVRVRCRVERGCAVVDLEGASIDALSYGAVLARRLLSRLGGEISLRPSGAVVWLPGVGNIPKSDSPAAPTPRISTSNVSRVLLVVDDEPELAPMFHRFLKNDFETILDAISPSDADRALASYPVTHLVVDATFNDGISGSDWIEKWRLGFPSIRFAAVFTGMSERIRFVAPGVDGVFIKPEGFDDLLKALRSA